MVGIYYISEGQNCVMKIPQGKKYAANSDERETLFPQQFDYEHKFDEKETKH